MDDEVDLNVVRRGGEEGNDRQDDCLKIAKV